MVKISTIYPRDIIGLASLIACFILIACGVDKVVSGIAIMIITFYFTARFSEVKQEKTESAEAEPAPVEEKHLAVEIASISAPKTITAQFNEPIKQEVKVEPFADGDFRILKK